MEIHRGLGALVACLLIYEVSLVNSHTMWAYPMPRVQNPGIKGPYPCGSNPFFSTNGTVLKPGPLVLQWTETINHNGAPFRIAISVGSDSNYDKWIMIDHIPHSDAGSVPKQYAWNFTVPNINCPRCSLQILQIMTDKITWPSCDYPVLQQPTDNLCFSVYHSCADVIITGTQDPTTYQHPNITQTPYKPREAATWYAQGPNGAWVLPGNWYPINQGGGDNPSGSPIVLIVVLLIVFGVIFIAAGVHYLRKRNRKRYGSDAMDPNEAEGHTTGQHVRM